jgi:hypothetical protein
MGFFEISRYLDSRVGFKDWHTLCIKKRTVRACYRLVVGGPRPSAVAFEGCYVLASGSRCAVVKAAQ